MGMDKIKDDSNLKEVLEEYRENGVKGLVAENIKLLREALKRYPNNYDLLRKLSVELYAERTSAETFPSIGETSTVILYPLYTGDKQIEQAQWNVISGTELICWALYTLSDMNCNRSDLKTADRLRIMKKALYINRERRERNK